MDYSQGVHFETSLINMEEAKELTMNNKTGKKQQKRCRCGSIKHSRVTSKDCPVGLAIRRAKKLALGMGLSQSKENNSAEDAAAEEKRKCLTSEANGEVKKSDEGASAGNLV